MTVFNGIRQRKDRDQLRKREVEQNKADDDQDKIAASEDEEQIRSNHRKLSDRKQRFARDELVQDRIKRRGKETDDRCDNARNPKFVRFAQNEFEQIKQHAVRGNVSDGIHQICQTDPKHLVIMNDSKEHVFDGRFLIGCFTQDVCLFSRAGSNGQCGKNGKNCDDDGKCQPALRTLLVFAGCKESEESRYRNDDDRQTVPAD